MTFASRAFTRAIVTAALALITAVVSSRTDLLIIASVMIAWVVAAWMQRPSWATGQPDNSTADPAHTHELHASSPHLLEGEALTLEARASDARTLLVLAVSPHARIANVPHDGARAGHVRVRVSLTPLSWGRHTTGPIIVHLWDSLGAFRSSARHEAQPMYVTPLPACIRGVSAITNVRGVSGAHTARSKGDGSSFADIREYQAGDKRRRINWRVTSRRRILHVNEAFHERDTSVVIITDTATDIASGHAPGCAPSSLDNTAQALSAIARHFLDLGDSVALHDLSGRLGSIPFGIGEHQWIRITTALAHADRSHEPDSTDRPWPHPRSGTLAYVLTPLLNERVIANIGTLRSRGAHVRVIDTLPADLIDISRLPEHGTRIPGEQATHFYDHAWALRGIRRALTIRECERMGVPVHSWERREHV